MASPLTAAKKQLRSLMKQRLANVTQESVLAQSRQLFETLQTFQPYKDAHRISIYLSMPAAEIQTDAIVRHALSTGKQVFVPYLHKAKEQEPGTPARVMDMVRLSSIQDYENLKRDTWGIPSIDPATIPGRQRILDGPGAHGPDQSTLDLVLVPGVAFEVDNAGSIGRLGHGKGFYDFFLTRYQGKMGTKEKSDSLLLYGLALTEQLLPSAAEPQIPIGPYDRRLHGIILGNGEIKGSTPGT